MASVTISGDFIAHVRKVFWRAIDDTKFGTVSREEMNVFTYAAPSAVIIAVAAVEAFVNEAVFGMPMFARIDESPLGMLDTDWLERLELKQKLVIIPQLLVGQAFDRGAQPYQDMSTLISIRNDMVHYKMKGVPPKYVASLEQRKIALSTGVEGSDYIWVHKLSCSEVIRWANNTASDIVHEFEGIVLEPQTTGSFLSMTSNFVRIEEREVQEKLERIDSASDSPAA